MAVPAIAGATLWEGTATPLQAPPAILADLLDPQTGEYLSLTTGADPTDAAVLVAIRTVRASGVSVQDVGQQFGAAKLQVPGLERFFREEVAFALRHLVTARQITITRVTVLTGDDWAEVQITYRNEALSALRTIQLPLTESMSAT